MCRRSQPWLLRRRPGCRAPDESRGIPQQTLDPLPLECGLTLPLLPPRLAALPLQALDRPGLQLDALSVRAEGGIPVLLIALEHDGEHDQAGLLLQRLVTILICLPIWKLIFDGADGQPKLAGRRRCGQYPLRDRRTWCDGRRSRGRVIVQSTADEVNEGIQRSPIQCYPSIGYYDFEGIRQTGSEKLVQWSK